MSSDNNIFLSAFLRAIRDACLRHVTFNSQITTSGFLCVTVDGNRQSQFVIDEVFRKPGQEDINNSFCLKSFDTKPNRPHHTQRFRESRPRPGSQIPVPGPWRTAGRRRNKSHSGGNKCQLAYPPNQPLEPRPCESQHGARSPRSQGTTYSNVSQDNYTVSQHTQHTVSQHAQSKLQPHYHKQRSPRSQGTTYSSVSQDNYTSHNTSSQHNAAKSQPHHRAQRSSRSPRSQMRTYMPRSNFTANSPAPASGTRHFFRSSSRNDRNNTTFTVNGVVGSASDVMSKVNMGQGQGESPRDTPDVLHCGLGEAYDAVYCRENMQNSASTAAMKQPSSAGPMCRGTPHNLTFNRGDVRKTFTDADKQAGMLDEQKPSNQHNFSREVFNNSSFNSVDRSDAKERLKGSTHTLSNPIHQHLANSNSYTSCMSIGDIDTSCELPRMSECDDIDYLSDQDISLAATEPPYGFLQHNIDPYSYFADEQNPEHSLMVNQSCQPRSSTPQPSPISEPVAQSSVKAPLREVYSAGDILDSHHGDVLAKPLDISDYVKSRASLNHSNVNEGKSREMKTSDKSRDAKPRENSREIKSNGNSCETNSHSNSRDVKLGANSHGTKPHTHRDISELFDDVMGLLSQSQHRDYSDGARLVNRKPRPRAPRQPPSEVPHGSSDASHHCADSYAGARHNDTVDRFHPDTPTTDVIDIPLKSRSSYGDEEISLKETSASQRDWVPVAKGDYHEMVPVVKGDYHEMEPVAKCDYRGGSDNHVTSCYRGTPGHGDVTIRSRSPVTRVRSRTIYGDAGSSEGHDSDRSHGMVECQVSVNGQRSSGSRRSSGSQGSAGGWSGGTEVKESPSVIKKKSKLRKWMRIFKKDSSPLRLRDAHHTLSTLTDTESHTSINWTFRHRHRCPAHKKKSEPGLQDQGQGQCQINGGSTSPESGSIHYTSPK